MEQGALNTEQVIIMQRRGSLLGSLQGQTFHCWHNQLQNIISVCCYSRNKIKVYSDHHRAYEDYDASRLMLTGYKYTMLVQQVLFN